MSENLKKSRRHWEAGSLNKCHECKETKSQTRVSRKPFDLVLCHSCWDFIYLNDRRTQQEMKMDSGERCSHCQRIFDPEAVANIDMLLCQFCYKH